MTRGKGGSQSGPAEDVALLEITWGVRMEELLRPMEKVRTGNDWICGGKDSCQGFYLCY